MPETSDKCYGVLFTAFQVLLSAKRHIMPTIKTWFIVSDFCPSLPNKFLMKECFFNFPRVYFRLFHLHIFRFPFVSWNAVKIQSKCSRNKVKIQSNFSQNSVKMQSKFSQNAVKITKFSRNIKMQLKCSQNEAKIQSKFSQKSISSCFRTFSLVFHCFLDLFLQARKKWG